MNAPHATFLQILRDRKHAPDLHELTSPLVQTARRHLQRFTPTAVRVFAAGLTVESLISFGRAFHFTGWTKPETWRQQLAESDDLASLPLSVLTASFVPAEGAGRELTTRAQLRSHVIGLLSRRAAASPDKYVSGVFMQTLLKFAGINIERHIAELWRLRESCPAAFEAAVEDRCDRALACVQDMSVDANKRACAKRAVEDHYLLHRASYLQLTAAYVSSCTRAELMKIGINRVDHTTANSASVVEWIETLGNAARDGLQNFIVKETTGGKAGSPGRLTRPELIMHAVTNNWEKHVGKAGIKEHTRALLPEAPRIYSLIDHFMNMPAAPIAESTSAREALFAEAGLKLPSKRSLRLFHVWNAGFDGGAMLIAMVRRFAEVVHLVRNRPLLLKTGVKGKPVSLEHSGVGVATAMQIALELADAVMGDFVPLFRKPDSRNEIAHVMLGRRLRVVLSNFLGREKEIWLTFDPMRSRGDHGTLYPDLDL